MIALAVLVSAALGILLHVDENLAAGALDSDFSSSWDGMSAIAQVWAAATKTVGPAPTFAPGALAEAALLLFLATVRHPTRRAAAS